MTDEVDPDIEFSPLGRVFTQDGVTVQVHIYRIMGSHDGWGLEVVLADDASVVWDDTFPTDQAAFAEFEDTVRQHGMEEFIPEPAETIH